MQQKSWRRTLVYTGATLMVVAVPTLALARFGSNAYNALTLRAPQTRTATITQVAATERAGEADSQVLGQFAETATNGSAITINLTMQARAESRALNQAVATLRGVLSQLKAGSLDFQLAQQTLEVLGKERDTFDRTWRKIGVPRQNQTTVQNTIINLQVAFVTTNTNLTAFQFQERASGSVTTFSAVGF